MDFDILSALLGLVVGVLVTVFVRELVFTKIQNQEHSKITGHWSLSENGARPVKLCAESLGDVDVPPGSQVLVGRGSHVGAELERRCEVRVSDRIQSSFALADGKAIVYSSGTVKPGTLAVWTYEDQVLQRLALEWDHAWQASEPRVPRATVTSLKDLTGQTVEVIGSVSDVAEKGGVHYVRLIENGFTATVASSTPVHATKGSVVRAIGTVDRALAGKEPVVRASKVEQLRAGTFA
jgi:hypothetical protein